MYYGKAVHRIPIYLFFIQIFDFQGHRIGKITLNPCYSYVISIKKSAVRGRVRQTASFPPHSFSPVSPGGVTNYRPGIQGEMS